MTRHARGRGTSPGKRINQTTIKLSRLARWLGPELTKGLHYMIVAALAMSSLATWPLTPAAFAQDPKWDRWNPPVWHTLSGTVLSSTAAITAAADAGAPARGIR